MPQQRMPMFGMPGMAVKSPEPEDKRLEVEKETPTSPRISQGRDADEVPDVEDVAPQTFSRTPTGEHPPPIPSESKFIIPRVPVSRIARHRLDRFQQSTPETVAKTYVACDGLSEYVMTVCVSSMFRLACSAFLSFSKLALTSAQNVRCLLRSLRRTDQCRLLYLRLVSPTASIILALPC